MKLATKFVVPFICCTMVFASNCNGKTSEKLVKGDSIIGRSGANLRASKNKAQRDNAAQDDVARGPWFAKSPKGRAILSAMGSGDPQALARYSRLRRSADVEWVEDLDYSVAIALTRNPGDVLAMADTPERLDRFCAPPFIEPEAGVERAYFRAAFKALRSIGYSSALGSRRAACEARLRAIGAGDTRGPKGPRG